MALWSLAGDLCFDDLFEPRETVRPKPVERASKGAQCLWIDSIEPPLPLAPLDEQPGADEDANVLRDGGPTHREGVRELTGRALPN